MMRLLLAFGTVLALTACAVPVAVEAPDTTAPIVVPEPSRGALQPQTVRSFAGIVQRMEPVVERECRRRAPALNCDFRIIVIEDRRQPPNAFQTIEEDGRPLLGFTSTLISDVRNADELAFVLGHEAAHHIAGHLERQRKNATLGAAIFGVLASRTGANAQGVQSAQELGAAVGARSYSKDFELEADELGTVLTILSGYDPVIGARYFSRIPDPGNRFLGTHPPNAQRIQTVRQTAARF